MLQTGQLHTDGRRDGDVNNNIINHIESMDKTLKIGHAVIAFIGLLITCGTMVVNQSNKIETARLRIEYLESAQRDMSLQYKEMNLQFKEINGMLRDILIKMENKANKK